MGQAKNVDALLVYFGEDPYLCLYEQGTWWNIKLHPPPFGNA